MSNVTNVKVYDLEESLHAAGYPMRTNTEWEEAPSVTLKRGVNLSKAADWVGAHDQFLTGIRVSFDLTFSNKAWVEAERYRFLEFVSSQSTMHRITKFDLDHCYNGYGAFVYKPHYDPLADYSVVCNGRRLLDSLRIYRNFRS